jgi:hypothetical protein
MTQLNAKALKITMVLDPAEVAAIRVPYDAQRMTLSIAVGDRMITADIATKSIRKAKATIAETGPEGCVALIQGKLDAEDKVIDAGLSAQPKMVKAVAE